MDWFLYDIGLRHERVNMSDHFTERMAAITSNLAMETYFTGATIDFPKMRQ